MLCNLRDYYFHFSLIYQICKLRKIEEGIIKVQERFIYSIVNFIAILAIDIKILYIRKSCKCTLIDSIKKCTLASF